MKALAALGAITLALLVSPLAGSAVPTGSGSAQPLDPLWANDLPPAPGPDYVWVPGHIEANYATRRWEYIKPSWQHPPLPDARYVVGKWSRSMKLYGWNPGHWEAFPGADNGATQPVRMVVTNAPPPDLIEGVYAAPGSGYAWINGYWWWQPAGKTWIWAPGYFSNLPRPRDSWIAARWEERDEGGWGFVPGHWRR